MLLKWILVQKLQIVIMLITLTIHSDYFVWLGQNVEYQDFSIIIKNADWKPGTHVIINSVETCSREKN